TIYNTVGIFDVTLSCDNEIGCVSSLTKKSYIAVGKMFGQIYAMQGDSIIDDEGAILCPGLTHFSSTHQGSSDYTWHIHYNDKDIIQQGQEFTYNLTDSGRIEIKLVYGQNTACPDSTTISFRVDHINADFEMDSSYSCRLPATLNLSDRSENAVYRKWILPDNTEDTAMNIFYTINHTLSYKEIYSHEVNRLHFPVIHVAASGSGCRDTVQKDFHAILPVARFMPDRVSGCIPLEVTFNDSSHSVETIDKWTYLINNTSFNQPSGEPFIHNFTEPGRFEVLLVIENEYGCKDTSYPVIIQTGNTLNPDFTISPEVICPGDNILLIDNTMLKDSIDFRHFTSPELFTTTSGNSTLSVQVFPAATGYKSVQLEVDYNGCISDTIIQQAFYLNPPAGSFYEVVSCDSPLEYDFFPDIQMASSLEWTINDSVIYDNDSIRFCFPSSGDYLVTLKAYNTGTSCLVSTNKTIKVREVSAGFTGDQVVCYGDSAYFNAALSKDYVTECFSEGFLWDFKDYTPPRRTYKTRFAHLFPDTGTYVAELVVRADNGCEDTIRKEVQVIRPDAQFNTDVDKGCTSGLTVHFTNTSVNEFPVTWEWIFGDNTSDNSSAPTISHNYESEAPGVFWAGLRVKDVYGCENDHYIPVSLAGPDVTFNADDNFICAGNQVNFTASYAGLDSFLWDFGDGVTSSVAHSHVYNEPGFYDVSLTASKDGCHRSSIKTHYISVEKADAIYSLNDSIFDCYPASVIFSHNPSSNVVEGTWTFGEDIQPSGYRESYQYTYSKPGTYNTSLRIRTANNCQASHSKTISVKGPYATFDFEPRSICYGDPVSFHLTSSQDVDEMTWIFGDGETSKETSPVHNYKAKGIIHPALVVKQQNCEVTLTYETLDVSDITAAFEFPEGKTVFCLNDELYTINQSLGYDEVIWSINDILTIRETEIAPFRLSYPGTMQIGLTVKDDIGCGDSLKRTINILPLPDFIIRGDTDICRGQTSSLQIDPAGQGWTVLWLPTTGMNDPASMTPLINLDSTQHYTAYVTDNNGCQTGKDILVRVAKMPVITRFPLQDTAIFIGEEIELSVNSDNPSANYSWTPDYHISCLTCNQPVVAPENDVIYTATITDKCYSITERFQVEVIIDFYIEAPDAFSPNGDGHNDCFMLETKNISEIKAFKIFNRWGNLVFETTRLDEGWDGTVNGKLQNTDTYAYYIRAVTEHGYEIEKKGNFLLLK
ncbi:MAG: PKD domain-containing protein, partial [Bacteroidales bacterium]|nr:PKD domain-containing protein [Bacteroidales bacterium]